ncbi:MAG: hypothetical protein V3U60_11140 [Gammaproteobacteria bacterium]
MKCPRIPAKDVKAALEKRVANHDRGIFNSLVADVLHCKPRPKDLRRLREDPERHARTLTSYAKLAGYIDKTAHVTAHYDMAQLAQTLLIRHGPDNVVKIWVSMGLPMSQLPAECQTKPESDTGTLIEHDPLPAVRANVAT